MSKEIQELEAAHDFCMAMSRGEEQGANAIGEDLYLQTMKADHPANKYNYTMSQCWVWCARVLHGRIARLRRAEIVPVAVLSPAETELASLRLLCKRILATYDSSGYAKGSVQELWREFQREVEK